MNGKKLNQRLFEVPKTRTVNTAQKVREFLE